MLSDFENLDLTDLDSAKDAFVKLFNEANAIKTNADRVLGQRKTDQETFRTEVDALKASVTELTAKKEEFENKSLINEGNFEELLNKQTEKMRLSFEDKLATVNDELEGTKGNYLTLQKRYNNERISGALRKAAETAGVLPEAIDDAIARASGVFSLTDDGAIEARDKDGNLMTVKSKQLSPDLFVKGLKVTAPHFWPPSKGAGAGGSNGDGSNAPNPFDKKGGAYSMTEQARIFNENPEVAAEMKASANGAG